MQILNLGNKVLNNYIIKTAKGCIVIDTGYAGGFETFRMKFEASGLKPDDIKLIFLTHAHDDHAGYLNELLEYTAAPVVVHSTSVERLKKGQNSFEGGCSTRLAFAFCKFMELLGKGEHRYPPVEKTDRYLEYDGKRQYANELGFEASIIELPGHTGDSIGLLLNDGILFCGDSAMNGFPSKARHTIWIENVEDFQKSWDRILGLKVKTLYPAHGRPFMSVDLAKFRYFLNGRKTYRLRNVYTEGTYE